jgi:hypothetical protein
MIDTSTLPWYSRRSCEGLASLENVNLHAIVASLMKKKKRMPWLRSLYRHQ